MMFPAGHAAEQANASGVAEVSGEPRYVGASARSAPMDMATRSAAASGRVASRAVMTVHAHQRQDRLTLVSAEGIVIQVGERDERTAAMSTPQVTEIKRCPEPVTPDTFIDDLRSPAMSRVTTVREPAGEPK
jgi:hypothetical protein